MLLGNELGGRRIGVVDKFREINTEEVRLEFTPKSSLAFMLVDGIDGFVSL